MTMSKQAGEVVAVIAASLAAATAVAMAIEATPGHGKFGRSRAPRAPADDEPAENPRKRTTIPNRADMIAALGLEPEGKKRSEKYDFTTKEYWDVIRNEDSRSARRARQKLGLTSR